MKPEKHFRLTEEFKINASGIKVFRIQCTRSFRTIQEGDLGGWIEKESNLSDKAWVYGEAEVYDEAKVYGHAQIFGHAEVCGKAKVSGEAKVYGEAKIFRHAQIYGYVQVSGEAQVYGHAQVYGKAQVYGHAEMSSFSDYCLFQSFGSAGMPTTVFRETGGGLRVVCGCFSGTLGEFEKRVEATHGNRYGREYKAIIDVIRVKFGLDNH